MIIEALLILLLFLGCLLLRAKNNENSSSKLYWKKNKRNTAILSLCEKLKAGYQPTLWATNSHVQTILGCLGHFFNHRFQFKTEYIQMRDGGTISLQWYVETEARDIKSARSNTDPILIISTWALGPDVYSICEASYKEGFQPVVYNSRGHNVPLTTRQFAAFLDADDFKEALDYIHNVSPFSDLFAAGYSLGAGPIFSYLGKRGKSSLITAAVFVSSSLDLEMVLTTGLKKPYKEVVNQYYKKLVRESTCMHFREKQEDHETDGSLHDILQLSHWDTSPYDGFSEWMKINNPMTFIRNIRTPALFINSLDDPVLDDKIPAYVVLRNNPYCLEVVTDKGGHCGFLEGFFASPWTNSVALEFCNAVGRCRSLIISPVKNGFTRLRSVTR